MKELPAFAKLFREAFLFFCLTPALWAAPAGDTGFMEPGLKDKSGILFCGGFESEPWAKVWGMAWGPEPAGHGSLVSWPEAFEGHSLRVLYPAGTFSSGGGLQFLTDFSKLSIQPQESLYLRYYVRFEPGFDFVKGGKLPGLAGGSGNTGGHKPNGKDGWSARVMWRADGKIIQYVYHPDQPGDYGEDFAWDYGGCPRYFKPGRWYCLETFVQMNSPGKKDGIIRSWLDGEKALEIPHLRFRDIPSIQIDKMEFSTFFGGSDSSWAPPRDETAFFDNFVIARNYVGLDAGHPETVSAVKPTTSGVGKAADGTLVFDGDHPAWTAGCWSHGKYDLHSTGENHTPGGGLSAFVALPDGEWGAIQFDGPPTKPSDYKTIAFWIYPTGCDVEFRLRFESNGSPVGIEKAVTGARVWAVNQWNRVVLDLPYFKIPGTFNRIVLTSNEPKAVSPFYLDDLVLVK